MGGQAKLLEVFETIDARGWEPPQPMMKVLEAVERLPRKQEIVLLVHCEPRPLFRILKNHGFDHRCRFDAAGHFEVRIWHAEDTLASSASLE